MTRADPPGSGPKPVRPAGPFVVDLFLALGMAVLLEFVLYAAFIETIDLANFAASTVELLAAPVIPGLHLVYPVVVMLVLVGLMGWAGGITARRVRLPLLVAGFALWLGLGLLTIVQWYR